MTYAPTVNYLRDLAQQAGAASFWHGKQTAADINYNAPFPQAHLFLLPAPLIGTTVQYQVTIAFYGQDAHENAANLADEDAADQSLAIQEEMDMLSQQFVRLLRESEDFDCSERIDRVPVLRTGAGIGTGFVCSFTLTALAVC